MSTPRPTNPEVCPLCGQGNLCAMEVERVTGQKQPPCWCTQASFSAELLARVPAADRGQACICAACAALQPPTIPTGATPPG
ncbi:cysteine-rich CWC family protein [Rhodoferax saidenbachensis]|uniref:Cysteine-rich CWC family protein n=1 Tax=Rhodoferax saidenbachensis TaxID=1484693 RepID=A0ABU1ZL23_9BURK|nr:cysteine-rich CWC family protein [Rhodoferax saidenbachensis]MDR7306246.1 hypothetical protein [Rhodoferax saidenbachensis]